MTAHCTVKISVYPLIFLGEFFMQRPAGLHYSVDLRVQTYTEPVPLKYGKLATKKYVDMRIFFTVPSAHYSLQSTSAK